MNDSKQRSIRPEPTATVQQAAAHMRVDFAQSGGFQPRDMRLVLGDIRSSVVVAVANPVSGQKKP